MDGLWSPELVALVLSWYSRRQYSIKERRKTHSTQVSMMVMGIKSLFIPIRGLFVITWGLSLNSFACNAQLKRIIIPLVYTCDVMRNEKWKKNSLIYEEEFFSQIIIKMFFAVLKWEIKARDGNIVELKMKNCRVLMMTTCTEMDTQKNILWIFYSIELL